MAAPGLKSCAPPIAACTSWLWLGCDEAFQGAVGAYCTVGVLLLAAGVEREPDVLKIAALAPARGSVPLPPKKD